MKRTRLIPEDIGQYLTYSPDTGRMTWNQYQASLAPAGSLSGCIVVGGYRALRFRGVRYREHRVAYFLMTGEQVPSGSVIDHINHDPSDNRWCNLRLASHTQNMAFGKVRRKKDGLPTGVSVNGPGYIAALGGTKTKQYLGTYSTPEEASQAYQSAFNQRYGPEWNIRSLASA